MRYLFLHSRFPGAFRHIAATLSARPGNNVLFLAQNTRPTNPPDMTFPGVTVSFVPVPNAPQSEHKADVAARAYLRRAEAFAAAMRQCKEQGFTPDAVIYEADSGVGIFTKDIFPNARRIAHCEWFAGAPQNASPHAPSEGGQPRGMSQANDAAMPGDTVKSGETTPGIRELEEISAGRIANQYRLSALTECHAAYCSTEWQKSRFPAEFRHKITVARDGVETALFAPLMAHRIPDTEEELPALAGAEEIVTYASRTFSTRRRFIEFCAALPEVLERRPGCKIVLMGEDTKRLLDSVKSAYSLPPERVIVTGFCPYPLYVRVLQSASLHVHLSEAYTLSRSLLEALCCGLPVLASNVPQVTEIAGAQLESMGLLLDERNEATHLANAICAALEKKAEFTACKEKLRRHMLLTHNLRAELTPLLTIINKKDA